MDSGRAEWPARAKRGAVGNSSIGVSARGIDADINARNTQRERRERGRRQHYLVRAGWPTHHPRQRCSRGTSLLAARTATPTARQGESQVGRESEGEPRGRVEARWEGAGRVKIPNVHAVLIE